MAKIVIACLGGVVAIGIILCLVMVFMGEGESLGTVLSFYFPWGSIVVFFGFWPIFSKHLK